MSEQENKIILTDDQVKLILKRLDELYSDLPLEWSGYALSAINDIEEIIYKK